MLLERGGEGFERGQVGRVEGPLVRFGKVTLHDIERGYARLGVAFAEQFDETMSEEAFACVSAAASVYRGGWDRRVEGRDLPPITSNDCPSNMANAGCADVGERRAAAACSPTFQVIAAGSHLESCTRERAYRSE